MPGGGAEDVLLVDPCRRAEDTGWTVEARTSFGRIRSDLPITVSGSLSTETIQGKIGDGACSLTLIDNNGSIEILKAEKKK